MFVKLMFRSRFGPLLKQMKNCKFIIEISPHFLKHNANKVEDIYFLFNQNGFKPLLGMNDSKQYDELFYHQEKDIN